jgi:hypothetical protein
VAQARYAGGLAPQQDAIRAQLEQTAIRSELIAAANEKRQLQARINALLGRAPAAGLAEPRALPVVLAPALEPQALAARVRESNATVRTEAARLQAAQANRDLAQRNRYPDFNVGVFPHPGGLAHHDLGRDAGDEHPAAAGRAPRAGERSRRHAGSSPRARRGGRQPGPPPTWRSSFRRWTRPAATRC